MTAEVKKHYVKYNGYRYYKGGAQQIRLGDWGRKITSAIRENRLDQKGALGNLITEVTATRFRLAEKGTTQADLVGSFSLVGYKLSGHDFFKKMKEGKYEFLEVAIRNEHRFMNRLNDKPGILDVLKLKDDHRIVDTIIVVISAEEIESTDLSHKGQFSGMWSGMKLTVDSDVSSNRQRTFEIKPNTVYAYGLKKIKWDASRKNKREQIEGLVDDPHGP